jgi:hypothetical protein
MQGKVVPRMQSWLNFEKSISVINHVNRIKNKSHVIILIDEENHPTKYNTMIKAFNKTRNKKNPQ